MGAISEELSLPSDPRQSVSGRRVVDLIYLDLQAKGLALPAQPANSITREELKSHLQSLIGELLKTELTTDPENRGYAAASNAQKYMLLTEPYTVQVGTQQQNERRQPRIAELLASVPLGQWDTQITTVVTNELTTDPENRGYAGMTVVQRRDSLCKPWFKSISVPVFEQRPPRLSVVLAQIPYAPNTLTPQQIANILS